VCRYQEGGRRGLPIAYINTLEKRLQDTEAALYAALLALEDQRSIRSGDLSSLKMPRELSKVDRQDEWKHLPLQTSEQLSAWFQHKHQQAVPPEPELPHIPFPGAAISQPEGSQGPEDLQIDVPVSATPGLGTTCSPSGSDSTLPVSSKSVTEQLKGIDPPRAPNTSTPQARSALWHNYF
jgi:hypothetical protein